MRSLLSYYRQKIAEKALAFLFPPTCLRCDRLVDTPDSLCASCWHDIQFINPPFCEACGLPFDFEVEGEIICGACLEHKRPFSKARSAMIYDEASRELPLAFKHGDRLHLTKALASWMVRAGGDLFPLCDMLVPVPLHPTRLWKRRYNQAALLAQAIGREKDKPVFLDALLRVKKTPPQDKENRQKRIQNVKKAFALNPSYGTKIEGRIIILVDDVLTTGATTCACAKVLKEAGAKDVFVLTLARTPHGLIR